MKNWKFDENSGLTIEEFILGSNNTNELKEKEKKAYKYLESKIQN